MTDQLEPAAEEETQLAQPKASMFERNVGHMASRGREAKVVLRGMPEAITGFFAGLDEEYVQVCNTVDQTLVNIDRDEIILVAETGSTLASLERESNFDSVSIRRIREKIEHFQRRSSYLFRKS